MSDPLSTDRLDKAFTAECLGRFEEARELLRALLETSDSTIALTARLHLGKLCAMGGRELLDEAESVLGEARSQAQQAGFPRQEAVAIHLLALVERGRGNLANAQQLLDSSPILKESASPGPETAQLFHYRGLIASDRGDLSSARSPPRTPARPRPMQRCTPPHPTPGLRRSTARASGRSAR